MISGYSKLLTLQQMRKWVFLSGGGGGVAGCQGECTEVQLCRHVLKVGGKKRERNEMAQSQRKSALMEEQKIYKHGPV